MKKLLTVLAAGLLVFGVAGMAKADFNNPGDLIQVVYQTTASGGSWEMATDLGSIASITANPTAFSDSFNLLTVSSALGGGFTSSSLSSLQVAYFAVTSTGAGQAWISGPSTGTVTGNRCGLNNARNGYGQPYNDYAGRVTFPQGVTPVYRRHQIPITFNWIGTASEKVPSTLSSRTVSVKKPWCSVEMYSRISSPSIRQTPRPLSAVFLVLRPHSPPTVKLQLTAPRSPAPPRFRPACCFSDRDFSG